MTQNLSLEIADLELSVRRFSVREELSRLFEINLWAKSTNANLALNELLGTPATFRINMARHNRGWQGTLCHAEQISAVPTGQSAYMFRLVPALWLTTQVRNHRIFQHKKVPDIVAQVLEPYQIEPRLELTANYPDREYVVQYGERDFDFLSRLLEQAGISYYFSFTSGVSELVFADALISRPERSGQPLHCVDRPHFEARTDFVTRVRLAHRTRPGKVTLRDFDFRRKPDFPLFAEALTSANQERAYEQYQYAPGSFLVEKGGRGSTVADDQGIAQHEPDEGQSAAKRNLDNVRRGHREVSFATNALDLAPGCVFKMTNHPHPELAETQQLLVTEFSLNGTPTGQWLFDGQAVFTADGYGPALGTRKPRLAGLQSAIVVGPQGEEIYTDEYGRVRAQFHWDREGQGISEGKPSSTWMRVSQPWAGSSFGAMVLPRIGQEVLVRYFEGDPDQPAVVGRLHNKLQPVPYPLPKHQLKTVFKTATVPREDGAYNELRLDDRQDAELFFVQAQRDRQQFVRHNETQRTGKNRATVIAGSSGALVGKTDTTLVGKKYSVQMIAPPNEEDLQILPQKAPTLTPLATKVEMVDKQLLCTTSGATAELNDDTAILEAKGEISLHAKGGNIIIKGGPKVKINC